MIKRDLIIQEAEWESWQQDSLFIEADKWQQQFEFEKKGHIKLFGGKLRNPNRNRKFALKHIKKLKLF